MHKVLVTMDAGVLGDAFVAWFDLDGVVIILQRKRQRVEKAVVSFRYPFAHEIMRQVAIVACRGMVVAALLPGIEMVLHHMAVRTRLGVFAEIAGTLPVAERKGA